MSLIGAFGRSDVATISARTAKIHHENERDNLLLIIRLVLRAFLQRSVNLKGNLMEVESQQLSDLFVMLEKIFWHGFKFSANQRSVISLRSPDAELWRYVNRVAVTYSDLKESVVSIDQMESIPSPICRLRSLLRLAVMQKKLADYFQKIVVSPLTCEYYEPWALLRNDEASVLSGCLVSLSSLDCNLNMIPEHLVDQPTSLCLSSYLCGKGFPDPNDEIIDEVASSFQSLKLLSDQKSFLEERNRYLEQSVKSLKEKLDGKVKGVDTEQPLNHEHDMETNGDRINVEQLYKERDDLSRTICEKDDTIRTLQQQMADTRKINVELYEKLRESDDRCAALEREMAKCKEHFTSEKKQLRETIEALKSHNYDGDSEFERGSEYVRTLRDELLKKSEEYSKTLNMLEEKQKLLNAAVEKARHLETANAALTNKLQRMPVLEQELEEVVGQNADNSKKVMEYEKALEELGGHLSLSKLQMLELREELLPLSEAQWEKDAEVECCKSCNVQFSVSKRKHHCRNCGCIFCNSCTEARVKLPSNPKAVRVCLPCYNLLRSRQSTTLADTSSLNSV